MCAVHGNGFVPVSAQRFGSLCRWRPAGAVQSVNGAVRVRPEHKAIAADPGHLRLANAQQHGTGNRGIHCVATGFEGFNGRLGREGM